MSNKVDFIVLNSAIKLRIVCDLAEKLFLDGKRLVIYSEKDETSISLDSMLWTWKQQSFIPHKCLESLIEPQSEPVILTNQIESASGYDTLLLHDPLHIDIVNKFSNIIDFAEKYDAPALEASRKRYKIYRDQNYTINTLQPGEYLHT
jgi:DNA polymerase-3 subunit chi